MKRRVLRRERDWRRESSSCGKERAVGEMELHEEYHRRDGGRLFYRRGGPLRTQRSENFSFEVSGGGQSKRQSAERVEPRDRGVIRRRRKVESELCRTPQVMDISLYCIHRSILIQ